ncbi:MAG: insulinase family protein [Candidatus Aminicenantes bacterium]|nr:MAG: insulinase family protein [Candidatus Aminicenantes bacterium]
MSTKKILLKLAIFTGLWLLILSPIFPDQPGSIWKNPPEKKILDNGLTLLYHMDKSSAITVLQILIKGGKGAEPEGKKGLAYLTTRLALEIPDRGKVQDIMTQASRIYMMGRADYSIIGVESLSENLEDTLKIASKIILKPLFSGIRINNIKEMMINRAKAEEDDSINVGHNAYLDNLFGKTAYGGSVYGSEESLKNIKSKDIKNFHKNYFTTGNMVLAVSSDLEEAPLTEMLNKYFSKFSQGDSPQAKPKTAAIPEEKEFFIEKDSEQSFVSIGFPISGITPKNFALAYMLEHLLGKGVGSRLWPLRSIEKLAYNINSRVTLMKDGSVLEAFLETDKEKKEEALAALRKVLIELYENGIEEAEFKITKIYSKAAFLRNNESKGMRTQNLAFFEAMGLGYDYLNKFFEEIDGISLEDMNSYIKDALNPENGIEILVGPKNE